MLRLIHTVIIKCLPRACEEHKSEAALAMRTALCNINTK